MTPSDRDRILVRGFDSIKKEGEKDAVKLLQWYCGPPKLVDTEESGQSGGWKLIENSTDGSIQLCVWPPAKKDFWRKTYYDPVLLKDDGPILYATLPLGSKKFYTIFACFSLSAVCQFDQAGIFIRLDAEHWIKTGIEVVDGLPRLSCVVTNVYSDWSTQSWERYKTLPSLIQGSASVVSVDSVELRVHCRESSYVVEAKTARTNDWEFVRIAHLSQSVGCSNTDSSPDGAEGHNVKEGTLWAGIFACCPQDQQGGHAVFHDFCVREGSHFDHSAD